jgi:predicted TIM-barrel fold metal-dependent hydrolase
MKRREFVKSGFIGAWSLAATERTDQSPARKRVPVVDAHCHAGPGVNYGKDEATTDPWTTFNAPEWTLRRMKEAGIDRTVIFPISHTSFTTANEAIAAYVRRWPDEFIGFAKHDGKTEAGNIRALLRHEVRDLGLKGLKLHGIPTQEMVETAAELKIPILYHPPKVDESLPVVRGTPEVPFVLAHLGNFASRDWREHVRAIDATKDIPNLYLETSSVVFVDYLERAAKELPAHKLIFGSDGPLLDARVELYKIKLLKLGPEKEALVLGGNMLRLLGA